MQKKIQHHDASHALTHKFGLIFPFANKNRAVYSKVLALCFPLDFFFIGKRKEHKSGEGADRCRGYCPTPLTCFELMLASS